MTLTAINEDGATPRAVAELNDAFRTSFVGGRVVMTRGVAEMPDDQRGEVLALVRAFADFTAGNDPHGEHDFGAITIAETVCFWKIDYYDVDLTGLSPDPADPAVTRRVLTVMLAEEY